MKKLIAATLLFLGAVCTVSAQDPGWPRVITKPQGTLVYYQPQVDSWTSYEQLDWRMAVSVTPAGGKQVVGALNMHGVTSVNAETQMVLTSSDDMSSMNQEAQDRQRGEQSSQRYWQQRSSGGWGGGGGCSYGGRR